MKWHFETYATSPVSFHFRGVGENNEIIFPSESYTTPEARDERIAAIKAGAATAEIRPGKPPALRGIRKMIESYRGGRGLPPMPPPVAPPRPQ